MVECRMQKAERGQRAKASGEGGRMDGVMCCAASNYGVGWGNAEADNLRRNKD